MAGFLGARRGMVARDVAPSLPSLLGLFAAALLALLALAEILVGLSGAAGADRRGGEGTAADGPIPGWVASQGSDSWLDLVVAAAALLTVLLCFGLMLLRIRRGERMRLGFEECLANAPDLLCIAGPDGRVEWLSASWRHTLGWTAADLSARPSIEFVHPDDVADTLRQADLLRRGIPVRRFENRWRHRDGSYRWLQWSAVPQSDGRVCAVVRDITEEKLASAALADSERRFRDLVEGAPQGIVIHRDSVLLFANPAFAALFGLESAEEAMALGTLDALVPLCRDAPSPLPDEGDRAAGDAPPLPRRRCARRRDGTEIWIDCVERTVDWLGQPAVQVTMVDVTGQKRAEDALREREERMRHGSGMAKLGYWIRDVREDRIVQCSEQFAAIHGVPVARLLADHAATDRYLAKCHRDDRARYERVVRSAVERGAVYEIDYRTLTPDGIGRFVREIGEPVPDETGQIVGYVGTLQDVTDLKRRELDLLEARTRLERLTAELRALAESQDRSRRAAEDALSAAEAANRAKTHFLATMSHELRTPLNAILGFAEIIRDRAFGPHAIDRYADYAADIHDSGRHLLDLINDILDISKVEAGKLELEPVWLDIPQMVWGSTRLVQERAEKNGISLTVELDHGLPHLWADHRALKQILFNLLSNSLKFTLRGGSVTVRAGLVGRGDLAISVADTGIGIPADQLARVMKPFEQIDNRYTRTAGGTGLGLPLVKALIELHGGDVRIDSTLGAGTTVTVRFPSARMPEMRAIAGVG